MFKNKKVIFGGFLCSLMALCFGTSIAKSTAKVEKVDAATISKGSNNCVQAQTFISDNYDSEEICGIGDLDTSVNPYTLNGDPVYIGVTVPIQYLGNEPMTDFSHYFGTAFDVLSENIITDTSDFRYGYAPLNDTTYDALCSCLTFSPDWGETSDDFVNYIGVCKIIEESHVLETVHAKVEATCSQQGHQVYYECECGKYFTDGELTQEITDLSTWLAIEGVGYIAPLGHEFGGEITYQVNGDKCTASLHCEHSGCTDALSETVTGVYVKDTDATAEGNEKGHYEFVFTDETLGTYRTDDNSTEVPDTKLKGGCFGSLVSSSAIFTAVALMGAILCILKRKTFSLGSKPNKIRS